MRHKAGKFRAARLGARRAKKKARPARRRPGRERQRSHLSVRLAQRAINRAPRSLEEMRRPTLVKRGMASRPTHETHHFGELLVNLKRRLLFMGIDVRQLPTHCLPIVGGKGPDGVAGLRRRERPSNCDVAPPGQPRTLGPEPEVDMMKQGADCSDRPG